MRWVEHDRELGAFLAPFIMTPVNTRVVCRSNALQDWRYGPRFRNREALATSPDDAEEVIGAVAARAAGGLPDRRHQRRRVLDGGDLPCWTRDFRRAWRDVLLCNQVRCSPEDRNEGKVVGFMRKLAIRDLLATLIVAAVVVPFVGYSIRGTMPFLQDPRGMAGVGIVGCVLAFAAFGREALGTGAFRWFMLTLGLLTIGFGFAALIVETSWVLLVPMVAGLVITWASALLHDAGYIAPRHAVGHA